MPCAASRRTSSPPSKSSTATPPIAPSKPLIEATAENFTIKEVPADKAYLSGENLELTKNLGAMPFIPFKINSVPGEAGSLWEKMFFYYQFRREEFLEHYHRRSNAESTFSMIKAKFRDHVRSRTDAAMKNEVLCKFICHNICCVIQSQCELGIETIFWNRDAVKAEIDIVKIAKPVRVQDETTMSCDLTDALMWV